MLETCIYNILDHILPVTDNSKHGILSLKYLSACEIMKTENEEKCFIKILKYLPVSLYEPLLQSVIYESYLKFTTSLDISKLNPYDFENTDITFPKSLGILILNWPHEDFVLRNLIPSLDPHVGIFPCRYFPVVSQKQAISQKEDLLLVFKIFCNKLIQCITQAVFKCTPTNTQGYACNIRRLDVCGLEHSYSDEDLDDILEGVSSSTIETFVHKIEILADYIFEANTGFDIIRKIFEESLKPDIGISVCFKSFSAEWYNHKNIPDDFYNVLSLGGCKYIQLLGYGPHIDQRYAENLCFYLPGLVGIDLQTPRRIESLNFLSSFENLEQLRIKRYIHNGLTNAICNLSKGLKYLNLCACSLKTQDLECLAKSIHSYSLLQLDLSWNDFENDSEAVGLVNLCQKLKNIKVLILDLCTLHKLSTNSVSKLVNTFKDCDTLEFLSMKDCILSLEQTHIVIDGLAQNSSLRYLCLDLPGGVNTDDIKRLHYGNDEEYDDDEEDAVEPNNVDKKYLQNLFQTFNEKMNKFRQVPIYISWNIQKV